MEGVFVTRSQGAAAEGVRDQYADGRAARVWEVFIGDKTSRTSNYREFLVGLLRARGCRRVLDVACGTGVDSVMLLEDGFEVTSVDASDKMLKYALKARWTRRKEPTFDRWVIEEANWLTLAEDLDQLMGDGFDAVVCLGNSFAHMGDTDGRQDDQRRALRNFERCVRPGGLLLIDHRNYDHILETGQTPSKCIYYNSNHTTDIRTSVLYVDGKPSMVTMDYVIDMAGTGDKEGSGDRYIDEPASQFRLSYYPHRLERFRDMLRTAFGPGARHTVFADFLPLGEVDSPAFYIHLVEKPPLAAGPPPSPGLRRATNGRC